MRIGKRVSRGLVHDHTGVSPDVSRHTDVPGKEIVLHADTISGLKFFAVWQVRTTGRARLGQRKSPLRQFLQFFTGYKPLLNAEGREACQRSFIVAGGKIV